MSYLSEQPEQMARNAAAYLLRPLAILREVRRQDIPADLLAGLTVAAVAIPQAIAYASVAELPPHVGLFAAAVGAVVGSLWGSSRHLATGPVNASSLLVFPLLLAVAVPGTPAYLTAAAVLAVLAGLMRIGLALLRMGAVATLASRSVLQGFIAGVALHIGVGQMRHLLGLNVPASPHLYETARWIFEHAGETHAISAAVGLAALVVMVVVRRINRRIPAGLLVVTLAAVAVAVFGLQDRGVRVVGDMPRSLPSPTWVATGMLPDWHMIQALVIGSAAVTALGLVEAVAASQTLARRTGDHLDPNQEFFGQGMANVAAGLLSGYPVSGSFTRSALSQQARARTHLAGVFTGLTILGAMLLLAPYARVIPRAAIAGVLVVIAFRMVDNGAIRRTIRTSRSETAIVFTTFVATLVLPLDFAILSGIVFSLAMFVVRSSLPRVVAVVPDPTHRHLVHAPGAPVCPQMGLLNIRGPLFFGAVYHIEEELRHNHERHPGQRILVLRMHGVDLCDMSGIEMLESTVDTYRRMGGDVYLVRPRKPVLDVLEDSGFIGDTLGHDHILEQEGAIEYLFEREIDPEICTYECEHRVFAECQTIVKHVYREDVPSAPLHPYGHHLQVSPKEFARLLADPDAIVLDLREESEYRHAHLPGAILMPLRELVESASELPRDRQILLVSRSGRRGARALFVLEGLGYEKLAGLRGGILAWRAAGFPVEVAEDG